MTNLDELEKLERKATKGPWRARPDGSIAQTSHVTREVRSIPRVEADAFLVVALRNEAVPMIQELRGLRAFEHAALETAGRLTAILGRTEATLGGIPMETLVEAARRVVAERDSLRAENTRQEKRLREATQKIVEAIGAAGPESLEDALEGLLTELSTTRAEVEGLKTSVDALNRTANEYADAARETESGKREMVLEEQLVAARAQLVTAREDALEEAAMTAGQWVCPDDYCDHRECVSAEEIESAIRALKKPKGGGA